MNTNERFIPYMESEVVYSMNEVARSYEISRILDVDIVPMSEDIAKKASWAGAYYYNHRIIVIRNEDQPYWSQFKAENAINFWQLPQVSEARSTIWHELAHAMVYSELKLKKQLAAFYNMCKCSLNDESMIKEFSRYGASDFHEMAAVAFASHMSGYELPFMARQVIRMIDEHYKK